MANTSTWKQWIAWTLITTVVLGVGVAVGMFVPQDGVREIVTKWLTPAEEEEAAEGGDGTKFELTKAAQTTLGLKMGPVKTSSYTEAVRVPAFVRELPAVSNLQAASRLEGSVSKVYVSVGQCVREGDPLVEMDLTGDELAASQAALLDAIKQLEILVADMPRLQQAASLGGPSVKLLRERKYERSRMEALIKVKREELLVRGLNEKQVAHIVDAGKLVRSITIRVPIGIRPDKQYDLQRDLRSEPKLIEQASAMVADEWVYSIEELRVSPGSVVSSGQPLCDLAYHETLLLEGQAYERDLPRLTQLIESQAYVHAELGDDNDPTIINDLEILFMDNHVDNESQTYRFYAQLANDVSTETKDGSGRRYRTWMFKPGQRGHIGLPAKDWEDKVVLPAEAVARDGIEDVVFRWLGDHNPWGEGEAPHSDFERVMVSVLYRDRQTIVVDTTGDLKVGNRIAMNNAYMLLLALQSNDDKGGGHSHHGHTH